MGKALSVLATQQGRELSEVHQAAGAELLQGSSLKAALDLNWEDPAERARGLQLPYRDVAIGATMAGLGSGGRDLSRGVRTSGNGSANSTARRES